MHTKNIVIFFLVLGGLLGLLVWFGNNQSLSAGGSSTKSELSSDEVLYDFGTISMANGKVSHRFKIKNESAKDILIPSLTTSCMCTSAAFIRSDGSRNGPFGMPGMGIVPKANEWIKVGETKEIEVVYDPAAHGPAGVGRIDRFVYLQDDVDGKIEFEIKALVTP